MPSQYNRKPTQKGNRSNKGRSMTQQIRQVVRSQLRPEVKCNTRGIDEASLSTLSQTPSAFSFCSIAQGTQDYERVGNKIKAIGLRLSGILYNNTTTTNYVRMLVLSQQNPETDMTSTSTNILDTNAITSISSIPGLNTIYSPVNKLTYQVLYDKVIKLGSSSSVDGGQTYHFKKFIKLNKEVIYVGSSGVDCTRNNIRLLVWAAEAPDDVSVGVAVELSGYCSMYYIDV